MCRLAFGSLMNILLAIPAEVVLAAPPDWNAHPINEWVRQSPREESPAPNFPYEGSGDYDPYARRWIHHAGHDGIPQGFHTFTFDLDSRAWRQLFPPTSPPGVCCVDGANAFDLARRQFVRFPGGSLGHGYQWSRGVRLKESPVWVYDLPSNRWTNMRPPPYGEPEQASRRVGGLNSTGTYDPNHELVLSFGGQSSSGGKNTLFAYDGWSNTFTLLDAANPPAPRDGMGLAFDARHDKLVMFGSQYLEDNNTWLYDVNSNRWQAHQLLPHPPSHKVTKDYCTIPRLAYDSRHGVVLGLFWMGEQGHETWSFDTGKLAWTKLNPAAEPDGSKSRSRNLGYDAERNLFILETSSSKTNRPEIWTYRYQAATQRSMPSTPHELEVVTNSDGTARLTWMPGPQDGPPASAKYLIYRGQAPASESWKAEFTQIGSSTTTSFDDRGLQASAVYSYAVKAVDKNGQESGSSFKTRTQPRVPAQPVVSVLGPERVEIAWNRHAAKDVVGYNLYRGLVKVKTVKQGTPTAWRDNDPEYAEPLPVQVQAIHDLRKLNSQLLTEPSFTDGVSLSQTRPESGDYKFAVYAYIVRAVNRLGTESGPSPYGLTIPAEPLNVFCREQGETAELKWDANPDRGIAGYHVYKLKGTWEIVRVTEQPIIQPTFQYAVGKGNTRFWVVAVDALGQEGQPSSPAWFNHSHRGFYEGPWHQ